MDIKCPHCSRDVQAENINIQSCIAKCGYCSAVFGFADMVPGAAAPGPPKMTVEMPKDYTMENEGADLVITRSWLSRKYLWMLPVCVFWDGSLIFKLRLRPAGGALQEHLPREPVSRGGSRSRGAS